MNWTGGVSAGVVDAMRDTLRHRGPDDAGTWVSGDGVAGLGHRRLSILDLSDRGHQPMHDPAGRAVICYNGEVYNFRDIRRELQAAGVRFESDTDTEVILHAYLAWGAEFVSRLEGMFAIALWDCRDKTLLLVRDRLGIKPVCYAHSDAGLWFGSEIRAVLASGQVADELSPQAAWDYFSYGYVPTPQTIYKHIRKLPPASMLIARGGTIEISRYWQPRFESIDDSPETARRRMAELIDQSVEDYLVADVPTGSYLSGGLDSNIVTQRAASIFRDQAATHRLGSGPLHTFTIGFDVAEHSENHAARAAAVEYGTDHSELQVSREMAHDSGDTVLGLFDEPFAASSTIPMTFLAELARQKVTVALCGEGGDETFGGYSWYKWWQRFQQPSFWATPVGRTVQQAYYRLTGRRKKKWYLPGLDDVDCYAQLMGAVVGEDKAAIFSPDFAATMADHDNAAYFRRHWQADLPPMARLQYVDMMTFLPDLNLARADRTSMRMSLELRVPLLNHRVVEYAIGLHESVRNPAGQLKGQYKQALESRLPESIRNRKKKGFSAPVSRWFTTNDLRQLIANLRREKPDLAAQWLHPALEDHLPRFRSSRAYKLWVFLRWLRRA